MFAAKHFIWFQVMFQLYQAVVSLFLYAYEKTCLFVFFFPLSVPNLGHKFQKKQYKRNQLILLFLPHSHHVE